MVERSPRRQVGGSNPLAPTCTIAMMHYLRMKIWGMRTYRLLVLGAAIVATALVMHGQEAAPPSVDLYEEQEQQKATVTPSPPPNGPELPELKQLDESFKPKSLGKDADTLREHIEWRQLENRTVNDPEVRAAKAYAQAARTDLEKRNRLRNYYDIYYQRMAALATTPELKVALEALKTSHQGALDQPRVRPTPDTSTPTPTPTPSGTPAPRPTPHKHKKKHRKQFRAAALPANPPCSIPTCILFAARSSSG